MKVTLRVSFDIPPHPNHTPESASLVADKVQALLRAQTDPDTQVTVSLFTPPAPAKPHPFPTP